MANHGASIKSIVSSTRIMFSLLPGMGALILIRMLIHLYRTDIEDIENRIPDTPADQLYDTYDFIIVGAGSAGSVLAARLSENKDWKILLLEAGQNENVLSEVPAMFPVLQTSAIDWEFVTEPSGDYCLSMIGKRCKWPRGKLLGGSSAINAMLYIRGNKKDYNHWASLGNEGWSYDEIFKYFLKAEDMRIPEYQNDPYHATGGPLTVEYFKYEQPITKKVLEAGEQLGYKILDVNGETQSGFTRSHATVREGLRCSTAKGYLRPASKRPNLHVSLHSHVEKVLVDEDKSVYGVQFKKHDETRIIKARKEVILSAGAIQSPQILMLSGIGDAEYLKELGIYPIFNLPGVGRNLQDHVAMGGHSFLFDNPFTNGSDYSFNLNSVASLGTLIDFSIHKEGLLYSMMEAEAMAFVNTKYQNPEDDYPDIQFFIAPTADNMDGGWFGKRANGLTDETYAELYEDILYDSSFSIVPLLLRPKSRGYLRLRDSNPYSPPLIYPNYYTHPDDVKIMMEGARIAQALTEQPALQELNTRPNPHRNPGCVKYDLMSDEHLECQARHHTLTIYHPVGTCAMGPAEDENAVVDPKLRVYGINKLRVVDGSVMPTIVSGNTNAPIIMIAEKASDMIKEDWEFEIEYPCENSNTCYRQAEETIQPYNESYNVAKPKVSLDVFNETTALFPNIPLEGLKPKIRVNKNKINSPNNQFMKRTKQNPYNNHPIIRYQDNISSRQFFNPIVSDPNQYAINPNFAPNGFIANTNQPNTLTYLNPMYQRTMDHPINRYQDNMSSRQVFNPIVSDPNQYAFNPNCAPKDFAANTNQANTGPYFNPIYQRTMDYNPYWIPQSASYQSPTRGLYNQPRNKENKKCRLWLCYNGILNPERTMEALHAAIASTCPVAFSGVTGGLFLRAMATAITTHCLIMDNNEWPEDRTEEVINKGQSYDFVVVGAGTAGSLVASYLSNANPSWSVLLIEAGDDTGVDSEIPAFLFLNQNSKSDWFYKTEPDGKSCLGFRNKSCIWSKGKCMGGSSSINAMLYIRGHPSDYDGWERLGNPDWGYDDLKIYFERQEQMFNIADPNFEGYNYEWYGVLDKAWNELGFENYKYNGHESRMGTRKVRILTNNGQRVNTARFFLQMAKNVTVMKNTQVQKVILNPKSNKVVGLVVKKSDNTAITINVNKEVILSAGSIGTPVILMQSGIGPKLHLDEVSIACVHDLPVGKNLQDHTMFPLFLKTNLGTVLEPQIFNLLLLQYVLTKTGPFSNIGITDYMGFINTNNANDAPNVQFHHTYFLKNDTLVIRTYLEGVGYENKIIRAIEVVNSKYDILGIYPTLLQPESIGEILLNDKSPVIKSNYFDNDNDLKTLLKSIDFVKKLEKTKAFRELGIEMVHIEIPGCLNLKFDSHEYWECYIKHMTTTIYHPVGTAKMGPEGDKTAVVDSNLLVHGVENLRVVDASVMPVLPKANTMAATLAIAQKAADIIVKQHLKTTRDEL